MHTYNVMTFMSMHGICYQALLVINVVLVDVHVCIS